jgi:hypothetical protein
LFACFATIISGCGPTPRHGGGTITDRAAGEEYKHWFRAKFLQQLRLFFRYQQTEGAKIMCLPG